MRKDSKESWFNRFCHTYHSTLLVNVTLNLTIMPKNSVTCSLWKNKIKESYKNINEGNFDDFLIGDN